MGPHLAAGLLFYPLTLVAGQPVKRYILEYRARDCWPADRLFRFQEALLERLIAHAISNCEYYRSRWPAGCGAGGNSRGIDLSSLPVLSREDLIENELTIRANQRHGRVAEKTSGGSTGRPVTVVKPADAVARERAATWRGYGWAGLQVAAPQARLWGVPIRTSGKAVAALNDLIGNRLRLSAFGLTQERTEAYLKRLHRFRPHFVYGYVSLVVELCRFLEATSSKLPDSVKCIVTTSEVLDDYSRSFIEEVTQLRVFNEYGCGEVGSIAHECEAGQLHIMADNLLVEVEASDDLPPGFGHLLVTDLHNLAMPLIRYRLGDLGILSNTSCPCGKPYPILERIVGRAYDLVVGGDGKLYHPEAVIYAFEELKRRGVNLPPYQVVQEADGVLDVRLAGVSSGLTLQVQEQLTALLKVSLDPKIRVTFQNVGGLEREASGKLRVVKRSARAARATV